MIQQSVHANPATLNLKPLSVVTTAVTAGSYFAKDV
jgi:hypothetical protein